MNGDSASTLERLIRRDQGWLIFGIAATMTLAWIYLVREAVAMNAMTAEARVHAAMGMAGMNMRAWDAADWLALFLMWVVMMVAMMLPSAAPVILLVLGAYRRRGDSRARLSAFMFVGGYLFTWTTFSAVAASAQIWLHRLALLGDDLTLRSGAISGMVLLAAGVYQWLPFKNRCLTQCQSPLAFLSQNWREGASGALSMGTRHGAFCVGCCWLLMLLLFVLGVMNLLWIALLSMFVLIEKVAPRGALIGRLAGVAAAAWGVYLISSSWSA